MRIRILLLSLMLLSFAQNSPAGDFSDLRADWYVHVGAGGNWAEDLKAPSVSYEFDPGYRFSVAPGAQIGKYFALEFETGLLWNDVDKRKTAAGTVKADGEFWRIPMLFNFIGRYPIGKLTPHLGVGLGGIYEDISATQAGITTSDDRFDGALQGLVGLEYRISERVSVGANYKYLRTIVKDDDWFIYFGAPPEKPKDHGNHSITLFGRFDF